MDFSKFLVVKSTEDYMCLFLLGLGGLLAMVALAGLCLSAMRRQMKAANAVGLFVVALLGCGMGGFATYFRMNGPNLPNRVFPSFMPVAQPADESDTVELTALKSASLVSSSQPVVLLESMAPAGTSRHGHCR